MTACLCAALTLSVASPALARQTHQSARSEQSRSSSPYLQCVTFARQVTGMQIFGDAWTWWEKATGKYDEGQAPKPGAVLVFRSQGKMKLGHVAVVSQVITDRYIQVTHANWSPVEGHRGRVEENVNVMDVSDKGDWSKVKVWYGPLNDLGTTVYSTYGFIYQAAQSGQTMGQQLVASISGNKDVSENTKAEAVKAEPGKAQQATQVAIADQAPANLPDELKAALTPETRPVARAEGRGSARAVTASAQITGQSAQQLVSQLTATSGHAVTSAEAQSHGNETLARP